MDQVAVHKREAELVAEDRDRLQVLAVKTQFSIWNRIQLVLADLRCDIGVGIHRRKSKT